MLFGFLLFFFFFCSKGCISISLPYPSRGQLGFPKRNNADNTNTACKDPFQSVGDYCFLIDDIMRGTWSEMRDVCLELGGDLVNMKDANIHYEISEYIKMNDIGDVNYWVGATDEAYEGKWEWVSDKTSVRHGTPLWGRMYGHQPDGGDDQNCAVLYARDYFFMHDESCDEKTYGVICHQNNTLSAIPVHNIAKNNDFNIPPNECPSSYEKIGNACLQVFSEKSYNWTEAKELCVGMHTHMVKVDDANLLGDIYDYLMLNEIESNLWLGGTDAASEGDWVWHDDTPIKTGTNYWNVKGEHSQEPDDDIPESCLSIWHLNSYMFSDVSCEAEFGVICEFDK